MKKPVRKLFGTDGVRGVANIEPMTTETAMRLGRAIAYLFHKENHRGKIVIGKDTRLSGYMFEQAMAAGICSMGADVQLVGPLPTPGIAFITSSMRADAGVVISASHNPYQDNGIKIFASDGFKLPDAMEAHIEELMESDELDRNRPPASDVGKAMRIDDARGRYIVFLKNSFPRQMTLDGIKIVVDCANGAAYRVAPAVLQELGATVYALGDEPDGRNINDHVGALYPQAMCQAVVDLGAHVGIALDGDADRVIFADERGHIVDGDAIMALCAQRMMRRGELRHNTLVATVMSNLGLERALQSMGGRLVRTQVGDRYVVEAMRQHGYNFGGEQSGHLIFLDHMTTGDGIVAALQVLSVLIEQGRPLSELAAVMHRYPQVLVNVKVKHKQPLEALPSVQHLISQIEERLGSEGRVLVRYSGTEPKARVMLEGPDERLISTYAHEIAEALQQACGA
ncbi:MAG: phosphoglucosamine mutase [Myxococcales bacterium]|nr:phosphoglucosamine mutase [Myxococcota bacterium]MDW8283508.1 phosphoglucosamine mutase [Myxococcales bacterium]